MTAIALFYLAAPRVGGWLSYTGHLAHALRAQGHAVALFKIGNRSERNERPFGRGLTYRNVALDEACAIATMMPAVVTAVGPQADTQAAALARTGATVVVHDPTELRSTLVDAIQHTQRVVTIRTSVQAVLQEHGVRSTFIPHPYVRAPATTHTLEELFNAVSVCRLDWDKRIDLIVQANAKLLPELRVRMFGGENRLYTHHKLTKVNEHWREQYAGPFPVDDLHAGVHIAGRADHVVDPSVIAKDGGGTQYTFLEAWDAGAQLLVNRAWLHPGGVVQDGVNARAFADGDELARILCEPVDLDVVASGQRLLAHHAPSVVVPQYLDVMKGA